MNSTYVELTKMTVPQLKAKAKSLKVNYPFLNKARKKELVSLVWDQRTRVNPYDELTIDQCKTDLKHANKEIYALDKEVISLKKKLGEWKPKDLPKAKPKEKSKPKPRKKKAKIPNHIS